MNRQRKVLITITYNEMGIIIDTKAEEVAQPDLQPTCNQLATDCISRQEAIRWAKTECNPYGKPTLDFESGKKVIEHLEQMPSAQPEVRTEMSSADDLISRQAAIDVLSLGKEILSRVLDDIDVVGTDREKYSWGLGLIESNIEDIKELPSAQPEQRWIPCSERLPEEHESIWAKAKGTDRWSEAMWEKQSDEVIVTELFEDGTTRTDTACTHDGEWYVKVKIVKRKIIAWMPLPEPYKERREE